LGQDQGEVWASRRTGLACFQPALQPVANPFTFTGREYDAETQTYYFRTRYYDPFSGRFLGEDPLFSLNPYPYAQNNPVSYRDPSGAQAANEYAQLLRDKYRQSNQVGYTVYRFFDTRFNSWYYGISRNMYARIISHGSRILPGTFEELGIGIKTLNTARSIEQALIQGAGGASRWGGPLANVINSISPSNAAFAERVATGLEWIANNLGPGFNFFPPFP
jgi:RHS repeat-associated protein